MTRRQVLAAALAGNSAFARPEPFRLAIAGLVHGHASGFLRALKGRTDVQLVAIAEPDETLHRKYEKLFGLDSSVFYRDLDRAFSTARPQAVAAFTNTYDHPRIVEAAGAQGIACMMEKPLAVSMDHAHAIERVAKAKQIPVIVNYETTWYRSHKLIQERFQQGEFGQIRRMVAMDGHQGPKEIGVGSEFLGWLTDPTKNGAGALFDFGCYGANLMTWLLNNQRPLAVTARTQQMKPEIYSKVDDEATIVLEYPKATGIIEASWNWPFSRKDLEVYGQTGYAHAIGGNVVRLRRPDGKSEETPPLPELAPQEADSVSYLVAVAQGRQKADGLSSLENNLIVTEILTAARESARTGRTVKLGS